VCGQELARAGFAGLCDACWARILPWTGPACARCGLPFASPRPEDAAESLCGICRREEFDFDWARSYGLYRGTLRSAILLLKFQRRERLGVQLGARLASLWNAHAELRDAERPALVPVPLHASRQRDRGFNQAETLARGLARKLKHEGQKSVPPVETRWLERTRPTLPQTGLSLKARRENVRGVFRAIAAERIRGRVAVLVDDVMTTGATLSACAAALRRAGADRVLALTIARATPQFPDTGTTDLSEIVDDFGPTQT
jgi:ComF family protein